MGVVNKAIPSEHVKVESRYFYIRSVNLKLFEVVVVEKMNYL